MLVGAFFFLVLLLIGCGFVAVGGPFVRGRARSVAVTRRLAGRGKEAAGTVVRVESKSGVDAGARSRYTTVGFRSRDGRAVEFREQMRSRKKPGDKVGVRYAPRKPEDATSHSPRLEYLISISFVVVGGAFALVGLGCPTICLLSVRAAIR